MRKTLKRSRKLKRNRKLKRITIKYKKRKNKRMNNKKMKRKLGGSHVFTPLHI